MFGDVGVVMAEDTASIWSCFSSLRDPRCSPREKKHLLLDIVAIALCGVIAGAEDWPQVVAFGVQRREWLQTFLSLPNGIPSRSTFERVFAALSPYGLQSCLRRWLHGCGKHLGLGHIAIDGKTLRASGNAEEGLGALHLVSAWATQAQLSLGQVAVAGKSNEITAIPLLLRLLNLKGALVTIDAMGCQKDIAQGIVDGGGDYVLTVKENQSGLYYDILASLNKAQEEGFEGYDWDSHETEERGHGRYEKRQYIVLYDLEGLEGRALWKGLKAIGMCYSERAVGGKTSEELRLFIGSRRASAKVYGGALRGHWGIENHLHWQLDVTFGEDGSRIQQRQAAQNMALLRKWALSLLKRHPDEHSIAVKRFNAALNPSYLQEILDA
jgi:predicted transposase YbfD/YdcC